MKLLNAKIILFTLVLIFSMGDYAIAGEGGGERTYIFPLLQKVVVDYNPEKPSELLSECKIYDNNLGIEDVEDLVETIQEASQEPLLPSLQPIMPGKYIQLTANLPIEKAQYRKLLLRVEQNFQHDRVGPASDELRALIGKLCD